MIMSMNMKKKTIMFRFSKIIFLAAFIVLGTVYPSLNTDTYAQSAQTTSLWTQTENPSGATDVITDIAIDSDAIYLVGYDSGPDGVTQDSKFRIEKRSLSTGQLISSFGTGGVITENPGTLPDYLTAVAVDSTGMYVAG